MEGRVNRPIICLTIVISERKKRNNEKDKHFSEWMKNTNLLFQEVQVPSRKSKINSHQTILLTKCRE